MEATIQKYEPYLEEVLAASEICKTLNFLRNMGSNSTTGRAR